MKKTALAFCTAAALGLSYLTVNPKSAPAPAVVASPVLWIGFADSNGAVWPTDDWTNYFTCVALTSPDASLPLSQWASNMPTLEMHNGRLCFKEPMDGLRCFYRGLYIYRGDGQ